MPERLLVGDGLVLRYGHRTVLDRLDLAVCPGEVVGLLGPNGAGKSSAFRVLSGLERADAGRVLLQGRDVTRWPLHRRARAGLAYLPQHSSVLPRLTAAQNVEVALQAVGRPASRGLGLMEEAGLAEVAARRAFELSGGERRRLEIARCLALDPRVVLLDEPFAGVDPVALDALEVAVRRLVERGIGVVLTDHVVHAAFRVCDRAILIDRGAVIAQGTPAELIHDPVAKTRYLGHGSCFGVAQGPFTPRSGGI